MDCAHQLSFAKQNRVKHYYTTQRKMARSRTKKVVSPKATESQPAPKLGETEGFYKKNKEGDALHFAPTAVHYPGGSLLIANHAEYTYPVQGWTYYESAEAAYTAEGLPFPEPKALAKRPNIAEKIAARRAMTREEREAERAQREANRIARLETLHPEKAAQLKARIEQRQERMAKMEAFRAMSPEERKAAQIADLEKRNPQLAAKVKANEAARAAKLASRPST